uniref:Uncharacterized protein n=1 Tax=Romanomermis culicivorax TaxID=13658 RepID=A0A915HPY8_ROMCU
MTGVELADTGMAHPNAPFRPIEIILPKSRPQDYMSTTCLIKNGVLFALGTNYTSPYGAVQSGPFLGGARWAAAQDR